MGCLSRGRRGPERPTLNAKRLLPALGALPLHAQPLESGAAGAPGGTSRTTLHGKTDARSPLLPHRTNQRDNAGTRGGPPEGNPGNCPEGGHDASPRMSSVSRISGNVIVSDARYASVNAAWALVSASRAWVSWSMIACTRSADSNSSQTVTASPAGRSRASQCRESGPTYGPHATIPWAATPTHRSSTSPGTPGCVPPLMPCPQSSHLAVSNIVPRWDTCQVFSPSSFARSGWSSAQSLCKLQASMMLSGSVIDPPWALYLTS